jgi:membrane-associated phospholipid phosphatase
VPYGSEAQVLGGGAIANGIRAFLRIAEVNTLDAFPSGHAAVSLTFLVLGGRLFPGWRLPIGAGVLAILFSTVYLSLHYVVDLVAGGLVAALVPATASALPRLGPFAGGYTGRPPRPPDVANHATNQAARSQAGAAVKADTRSGCSA